MSGAFHAGRTGDVLARLGGLKASLRRRLAGRLFNGAGDAGPRRLMLMSIGAVGVVGLVVGVTMSGRHAPVMSRDARMKAVDPLPGGLNSTPEQDQLALRANGTQAQAALRRGVSYTPPLAPSQKVQPAPPRAEQAAPAPPPAHAPIFVTRPAPARLPEPLRAAYVVPAPRASAAHPAGSGGCGG